jgi:rod shape-determining protein MreD
VKIRRIALLLAAAAAMEYLVGGSRHRSWLPIDWFLLATAAVARGGDFVRAVLAGTAGGLMEDTISQELVGLNAFAKAILGYALTIVSLRIVFGGAAAVGAALAVASLANEAIVAVLSGLLLHAPIVILTRAAIARAVATGIAGAALEAAWVFPWAEWWKRRRLRRLR